MEQKKINRLNELALRTKMGITLTPAEKDEQARLRKEFVSEIKGNLNHQLDNTYILEPDGTKRSLKRGGKS